MFYFTSVFGLSYGMQSLHITRSVLLLGVTIGNLCGIFANPLFGALSDRVGRRPLMGGCFVLAGLFVLFAFFPLLASGHAALVVLGMAIPGGILQPMPLSVDGSFYPEMFADPLIRFNGCCRRQADWLNCGRWADARHRHCPAGSERRQRAMGGRLLRDAVRHLDACRDLRAGDAQPRFARRGTA